MLELLTVVLACVHFGIPLIYYSYARFKWLCKPWNAKMDEHYKPRTTVIVPTYNEAKLIRNKLDNLYAQDYPKDLTEIIVVDSASDDGTADLVGKWASKHGDANLKLVKEAERRGKVHALNYSLKYATGEIIVIADAVWPSNALKEVLKWFAEPAVGAV